jgi:hypothetical protein
MNDVDMKRILTSFRVGWPDLEIAAPRLKLRVTLGLLSTLTRLHLCPSPAQPSQQPFHTSFLKDNGYGNRRSW